MNNKITSRAVARAAYLTGSSLRFPFLSRSAHMLCSVIEWF